MYKILFTAALLLAALGAVFGQSTFAGRLADSAFALTEQRVTYDPSYFSIDYPNGIVKEVSTRANAYVPGDFVVLAKVNIQLHIASGVRPIEALRYE